MSKNARELLEEGLSYISLPVALYGGVQITGWVPGAEMEPRCFGVDWFEALEIPEDEFVLDDDDHLKIEAVDPEVAHITGASVSVMSVCAIGAVALASLDSAETLRAGKGGKYSDWSHQIRVDPEVALASVFLGFMVKGIRDDQAHRKDVMAPDSGFLADEFFSKGIDYWIESYRNVIALRDKSDAIYADVAEAFGEHVEKIGQVITTYNDEQTTWHPVANVFETAIKAMIEKGF